jgi:sugar/nucleoside kinase (ribokinase family)
MTNKIVVAGVTSLYTSVRVDGFPLRYAPNCAPQWMTSTVKGVGCHVAKVLRTLGDDVALCTIVGRDLPGVAIRADLKTHGLLGPGVIDGERSSLGVALVAPDGQRMGFPHLSPLDAVDYPAEVFTRQALDADLAVLSNAAFVRPLIPHAVVLDVPIAVDVHLIEDVDDAYNRPWLEAASIVFCSHERLACSARDWITRMFDRYTKVTVVGVGQGAQGCTLGLRDGTLVRVAATAPRGVVNTSGAGDALFASFLHGWLATRDPARSLESAVLHAGWKIGDPSPVSASLTESGLTTLRSVHPVRANVGRWDSHA